MKTKRERILAMLADGVDRAVIARRVGCTRNYVCQMDWGLRNPTYHAKYMARLRATNPAYYHMELRRQRKT